MWAVVPYTKMNVRTESQNCMAWFSCSSSYPLHSLQFLDSLSPKPSLLNVLSKPLLKLSNLNHVLKRTFVVHNRWCHFFNKCLKWYREYPRTNYRPRWRILSKTGRNYLQQDEDNKQKKLGISRIGLGTLL